MKTKYIWLGLLIATFTACSDDDDNTQIDPIPELTAGTADFSNFVSIGNSLTAGFTDNALFQAGQTNSFPNLLAQRFALVGGGLFTQPLTNDNIGGLLIGGNPLPGFNPRLVFDGSGPTSLQSLVPSAVPTTDILLNNPTGPFNNMGVPGATSFQVVFNGLGNPAGLQTNPISANPYFIRMASNPNASMLEDAIAQNPTFVSLWIGNNDVLGFATSGGDQTISSITPQGLFDSSINTIVNFIADSEAQAVMANIPDVTTIPFFTTVPFAPLSPANPDFGPQIPTLNGIFGMLNQVYEGLGMPERSIVFSETAASSVVIVDEDLADISTTLATLLAGSPQFAAFVQSLGLPVQAVPMVAGLLGQTYGQTRQTTENDLLTLTSAGIIGTVDSDTVAFLTGAGLPAPLAAQFSAQGITLPLADRFVLTPAEQQEIQAATTSFNATIEAAATAAGFAFVDANSLLTLISRGEVIRIENEDGTISFTPPSEGAVLTGDLVTGGAFSLDGVHPTARGYAVIANAFMRAIDLTYGSNFEASGNFYNVSDSPVAYPATLQ